MRDLSKFKPILEKIKEELLEKLREIEQNYENEAPSEEVERSEYMHELKKLNRERSLVEETLLKVDAALKRFEDGTYGKCIDCGKEIQIERLEAVPYAERCLECKAKYEKGLRS